MMSYKGVILRFLLFSGTNVKNVGLDFEPGPNLIYGASNTGKSLALKALDFMLGASNNLPSVKERVGYDMVWLGFEVTGKEPREYTLSRSISGGAFILYEGLSAIDRDGKIVSRLEPQHDSLKEDNISQFLLKQLGLNGKSVAKNKDGEKESLTFRDLAHIQLVTEKAIQDEISPIEGGQRVSQTKERRVFRTLISGEDDSGIIPVIPQKKFKASKEGKLEVVEEIISDLNIAIKNGGYGEDSLPYRLEKVEIEILDLKDSIELAQKPVKDLIKEKGIVSSELMSTKSRHEQVKAHLERFYKLDTVYSSDIERLQSIEEAGFLLSIGGDRECPLCGASADAQTHSNSIAEIEEMRSASLSEINKIEKLRLDLSNTVRDLQLESNELTKAISLIEKILDNIDFRISKLTPDLSFLQERLDKAYVTREQITTVIGLYDRRNGLINKREEIMKSKSVSKKDKPKLEINNSYLHDFCRDVIEVLKSWGFPGECAVSFDEKTYDIKIDGKLRTDNGKGVRAITHAAFKVALLIYCRRNNLPHTGFLILDTPLLTYRDPLKSKYGELSNDEKALAVTPLKDKFFAHLHSLAHLGQFIIFENIDPPQDIENIAHVHEFTGTKGNGRYGLFPV